MTLDQFKVLQIGDLVLPMRGPNKGQLCEVVKIDSLDDSNGRVNGTIYAKCVYMSLRKNKQRFNIYYQTDEVEHYSRFKKY